MPSLKTHCPNCGKIWITKEVVPFLQGSKLLTSKSCEHVIFETEGFKSEDGELPRFSFRDGTKPYPFQLDNIKLFLSAKYRAGIFDEVGLGKTISALGVLRLYDLFPAYFPDRDVYPVAVLVKSGLRLQWQREIYEKLGKLAQIVDAKSEPDYANFQIHIYSMDYLKGQESEDYNPYNTIIIDECHLIKNPESQRTNAVRDLIRGVGRVEGQHEKGCPAFIGKGWEEACTCPPADSKHQKNLLVLSGTPIKNNAGEYFVICNLMRPDMFPTHDGFIKTWVHHSQGRYGTYAVGALRDPARFKDYTKSFFIRHTKKEVLPDLPDVVRNFQIRLLEGDFEKTYAKLLKEYAKYYDESEGDEDKFERSSNILAYMNKMRHVVGLAKVKEAVEFIAEFLQSSDEKLVVFVHHKDVAKLIAEGSKEVCKILGLADALDITDCGDAVRAIRVDQFVKVPGCRLMIASTLKSGEGLNLQVCSNCLIVERQWNPANEEQAEGRFRRIGSKADKINSNYLISAGSIDEMFTAIVERKRKLIEDAHKGEESEETWDESSVMKELQETLAKAGRGKYDLNKKYLEAVG